jgi:hypothetical protein
MKYRYQGSFFGVKVSFLERPQWSREVAWAIVVNKLFFLNGPNGPVIVYCIFMFHGIQTPDPLFCCKMTSPQQCTVCTRFLHMARKGL